MVLIQGGDPQGIESVVDRSVFMASLHRHRKMDLVVADVNRLDLCDDAMVPTFVVEARFGGGTCYDRLLSALERPKASQC